MNKMKIKIFTLLSLLITFSLTLSSCDSLWDDLNTLPTYTITYVSDKGTAPETKTVEQGYKLTAEDLPDLTETGYNFKGWDKVVGDEITSDITITASWVKTWTITYNSNNGTGTMEPQIFEENVPQALSENKFTREGYTFAGWATKTDASTAEYVDKANYTATEDITLYAIWSVIPPARFTITYASTYGTKPANKEVDKGYKLTAEDLPDLTETGYRFINWDKAVGDEITSDTTITASWVKTWNISYASNKTELKDKLPASKTVDEGYKLTAADLNTLTADGYNFKGWDKVVGDVISSDTTITATWKKLVTITYASNKTELKDKLPASKIVDEGYKLTADDLTTLTADGYNFKGWDKSAGDVISSDTTITATWKKLVTISYASNKTELNNTLPASKTVEEGYKLTADDLSTLTANGYNFKGWNKSAGDVISSNTTITANWKKLVTISYSSTYGTKPDNKNVEEGYTLTATDLPDLGETSDKYFDSWDKTVGAVITADTTITTITANWEDIVYLKKLTSISEISSNKAKIEKIVFTSDSTDSSEAFYCADSTTDAGYFKGVLTDRTVSGQYILTIYGNGHRIYAPADCNQLFMAFSKVSTIEFNNFYTSKVTDMTMMFAGSSSLKTLDLSSFNTSSVTTMKQMFYSCGGLSSLNLSKFDTSSVTDMSMMFRSCKALETLDLSSFVTSSVKDMSYMFEMCNALTSLNVKNFNTSSVENMSYMFQQCKAFTSLDLSSFDTKSVKNMSYMFKNCEALLTLDLSNFDTSSVENMTYMISYCYALTKLDLSKFDTKSVKTMQNMFTSSKAITELIIKFDTVAVTDMSYMFAECNALKELDISTFTKNAGLSNIKNMFINCKALEKIYVNSNFDLSGLTSNNTNVFSGDTKLKGGNGTTCDGTNNIDNAYAHIDEGTSNPGYFTLKQ